MCEGKYMKIEMYLHSMGLFMLDDADVAILSIKTHWRDVKTFSKVWWYGIVVVSLQHQNPQASQRCSNRGSFYF